MSVIFCCLFLGAKSSAETECPDIGQYEKYLEELKNEHESSDMIELIERAIETIKLRSNFILELVPIKDVYVEGELIDIVLRWTNVSGREAVVKYGAFGSVPFSIAGVSEESICPEAYIPRYPMKKFGTVKPGGSIDEKEALPVNCTDCEPFEPGKYVVTVVGGDWAGKSLEVPYNKCYAQPIKPVEIIVVPKGQQGFWSWLMSKFNMKGKKE